MLIFAQSISFTIKLNKNVTWYWREVFWGSWILLAILAGEVLVLSLLSVTNCDILFNLRNYRRFTNDCRRCIFTMLNWLASSSLLFLMINLLISLYSYLDAVESKKAESTIESEFQNLNIYTYAIMGWIVVVLTLVSVFKKALM